jgi:hypothetical protein
MLKTSKIFKLIIYLTICFPVISIQAQDIITKNDGTDIQAKVLKMTTSEVKYKQFDNQDTTTLSIFKSDVLIIRYENGTKVIFNQNISKNEIENDNMCLKGEEDSRLNYKGENSGAGWVCTTTILLSPLIGVIPALFCSNFEPEEKNLNYKNPTLMKNYHYNKCYIAQAHKTKLRKIWTYFGIGSGIWLIIFVFSKRKSLKNFF